MRFLGYLGLFGFEIFFYYFYYLFVRNEFSILKFDDEGRWFDIDSRMLNDWIEFYI